MPLLAYTDLTYNSSNAFAPHDSGLGFSLFTRRYLGNRCCFLFHRLVICLSSAGRSWIAEAGDSDRNLLAVSCEAHETSGLQGRSPDLKSSPQSGHDQYPNRVWIRFINGTQQPTHRAETRAQLRSTT